MADLKFYFPSTGAAAVSPAYSASWTTGPNGRLAAVVTKINSADLLVSCASSWGSTPYVEKKMGERQFVTDAQSAHEWTIGDTIKFQIQKDLDTLDLTGKPYVIIRVVSNDGGTFRSGILYEGDMATNITASRQNKSLGAAGAAVNVQNSCSMQANDRIVIEIGYRGTAASDWQSAYAYIGDLNARTDLPENDTDTGTDHNAWVAFTYGAAATKNNVSYMIFES
jgi:hypothetical protein